MKITSILLFILLLHTGDLPAQGHEVTPVISRGNFTEFNREVSYENNIAYLNPQAGDGLLWLNGSDFGNGVIELELKGRNIPGRSFIGIAFHGKDNETFDAIYFRPFNFRDPERNGHSVQYIAMPGNDWSALRQRSPGKYEHEVDPIPDPADGWFRAKIVVNYPEVKVYVNDANQHTLEVHQLSDRKEGKVGFWVGNGSDGWFRDLKIIPAN